MGYIDDVFDIDAHMRTKQVPVHVKTAWKRHRDLFCKSQEDSQILGKIRGAIIGALIDLKIFKPSKHKP